MNDNKLEEFNKQLSDWKGASVSFHTFTHSHFNMLTIKIVNAELDESLGLVLSVCSYISGPVSWNNSDISIDYDHDDSNYVVTDKSIGLFVKCAKVMIGTNLVDNFELEINFKQAKN